MSQVKLNLPENNQDFKMNTVLGLTEEQFDKSAEKLADLTGEVAAAMMGKKGSIKSNLDLLVAVNELTTEELLIAVVAGMTNMAENQIQENPLAMLAAALSGGQEEEGDEEPVTDNAVDQAPSQE